MYRVAPTDKMVVVIVEPQLTVMVVIVA